MIRYLGLYDQEIEEVGECEFCGQEFCECMDEYECDCPDCIGDENFYDDYNEVG